MHVPPLGASPLQSAAITQDPLLLMAAGASTLHDDVRRIG
jgi:hypothetical protein